MPDVDRRAFLKMAGLPALASLPMDLGKAPAIPAHHRTGTIADVEHVIILMQENRSFDHYFGAMRGVRGFADPHPGRLPNGNPVWRQPGGPNGEDLLPFRPDVAGAENRIRPGHGCFDHRDEIRCGTDISGGRGRHPR
jgi:phospholipase C